MLSPLHRTLSATFACVLSLSASATPVFWNAGTGTWTTSSNWDPVQIPLAGDDATVNNNGTANQAGLPITVDNLNIGFRTSGVFSTTHGRGTVNLSNGNATISNRLRVGVTDATIGSDGFSNGTFTTSGSPGSPGDVRVDGSLDVGVFRMGPVGSANGLLDIQNGDLTGNQEAANIGSGVGDANGTVNVAGDFSNFDIVRVGDASDTGDATGSLTVDGEFDSNFLRVGIALGTGTAQGSVEIGANTEVRGASIGVSSVGSDSGGFADGSLDILSGGLDVLSGGSLLVGVADDGADASGSVNISGGLRAADEVLVGASSLDASGSDVNGVLNVFDGGLNGRISDATALVIGRKESVFGSVAGEVTVHGGSIDLRRIDVGIYDLNSIGVDPGAAEGTLRVLSGNVVSDDSQGDVRIGRSIGAGGATGRMEVAGDLNLFGAVLVATTTHTSDVEGHLTIGGGFNNDSLTIASTSRSGNAVGTVEIGGTARAKGVDVGVSLAGSLPGGLATGELRVLSGGLESSDQGDLRIGHGGGLGGGIGRASIDGGIRAFDDVLVGVRTAGTNTSVDSDIDGTLVVTSGGITATGSPGTELRVGDKAAGSGSVDGAATVNGNIEGFETLSVGTGTGVLNSGLGTASGMLDVLGGDIIGRDNASNLEDGAFIGISRDLTDADGHVHVAGDFRGYRSVDIGFNSGLGGTANGELDVGGNFLGNNGGTLQIGRNAFGDGSVTGRVRVTGDLADFDSVFVGVNTSLITTSHAAGSLEVVDGSLAAQNLIVARGTGDNGVSGEVILNNNLAEISNILEFGSNARIELGIDGFGRGVEYGAFNAATAFLNGVLDLMFTFQPLVGVFDLVVSDAIDGIVGDFSAVNFFGLTPGTLVTHGTVIDQGVAIYRLEIGQGDPIPDPTFGVPEPSTLFVFCVGILGLAALQRGRRDPGRAVSGSMG